MLSDSQVATYPYAPSAKGFAKGMGFVGIGATQIESASFRVADRVERGLKEVPIPPAPKDAQASVSAYAISRILLRLIDSEYYWAEFAKGESQLARAWLDLEKPESFFQACSDFFPSLKLEPGGSYSISLSNFLSFGYDLHRRELQTGRIYLARDSLSKLFSNAVFHLAKEPPKVPLSEIPKSFQLAALELSDSLPKPVSVTEFKGSYLSLPCMVAIMAGVGEGKRYYASMALASACRKDGLTKEKALQVMQTFVANSKKTTHDYTMREATAVLDWVYRRPNPLFSCNIIRQHGLSAPGCGFPCVHDKARKAIKPAEGRK